MMTSSTSNITENTQLALLYKCYGLLLQNIVLFEFLDLKHNFNYASFDHPKGKHGLALYFLQSRIYFICQFPSKTKIVIWPLIRGHQESKTR